VQNGQHLFAADSLSAALLTSAGVAADLNTQTSPVICPGSTTAAKAPMASHAGYRVRVRLEATADRGGWLLSVENWRIVRTIEHFIT
jgi:hypothetical protein